MKWFLKSYVRMWADGSWQVSHTSAHLVSKAIQCLSSGLWFKYCLYSKQIWKVGIGFLSEANCRFVHSLAGERRCLSLERRVGMLPVHHKSFTFSKCWAALLSGIPGWVQLLPEHPRITLWKFGLGELSQEMLIFWLLLLLWVMKALSVTHKYSLLSYQTMASELLSLPGGWTLTLRVRERFSDENALLTQT